MRSSREHEHQRGWEGGGSEAGAQSRPWASMGSWEQGALALASRVPRGCWGLAAKCWRRRTLPQTSGCTGPHGSPPPPGTALGWGMKPPFFGGATWGGVVQMPGGILGTIVSPGHGCHMCIACTPSEGACARAWPGWVWRSSTLGDCGSIPVPIQGWESVPAVPPESPGWDQTGAGGWMQGCKVGMKVGNGAINGKAIRPFSSSPSSSSLRHLLSSSTSTSFLLSLSAPPLSPLKDFSLFLSG